EPVVLAPGQRAQARHPDRDVGEGIDRDVVAADRAGEVAAVEHVGDDRAAPAALDDRHPGVAAGDAGDLVPRGDQRLHGFLPEHACGTGDPDPPRALPRRAVRSDPRAQTFLGGSSLEDGGGYPYPRTSRGTSVSPTTKAPSIGTGPSHRVRHQGFEPRTR